MNRKVNISYVFGDNNLVIQDSQGEIRVQMNNKINELLSSYRIELPTADKKRTLEIKDIYSDFIKLKKEIIQRLEINEIDSKKFILEFEDNLQSLHILIYEINHNSKKVLKLTKSLFYTIIVILIFVIVIILNINWERIHCLLDSKYRLLVENPKKYYNCNCSKKIKDKYCDTALDTILNRVVISGNIDTLSKFIINFCSVKCNQCDSAKRLYESMYFNQVKDSGILSSYYKFIYLYGRNSKYYSIAIDSIQNLKFKNAEKINDIKAYSEFIQEYGEDCCFCKKAIDKMKDTNILLKGVWSDKKNQNIIWEINNGQLIKNEYGITYKYKYKYFKKRITLTGIYVYDYLLQAININELIIDNRSFKRIK